MIEYIFSAVSVCFSPCAGPLPKIKISFFLLSIFVDELMTTPTVITFRPNPVPGNEKLPFLSNQMPYLEYLYLQ